MSLEYIKSNHSVVLHRCVLVEDLSACNHETV